MSYTRSSFHSEFSISNILLIAIVIKSNPFIANTPIYFNAFQYSAAFTVEYWKKSAAFTVEYWKALK